jgi:prepilin-type N-terminal cleavage/methylation domain-containing protein
MTRRVRVRQRSSTRRVRTRGRSDVSAGFSLIEVLLVIVAAGILFAIASPSRREAAQLARDVVARANIRNVLFAQLAHFGQYDDFTADARELLGFEPALALHTVDPRPGSVYIVLGQSSRRPALCLFAEGSHRMWHTLYYSSASGGAVGLSTPEDCVRRMLDEQLGQKPPDAPNWREPVPLDTLGPNAVFGGGRSGH